MASHGDLESALLLADADRFRLLGRLLEKNDLEFLAQCPSAASRLRNSRARIFRGELGAIRSDVHTAFRSRLNRIGECGQWSRIFGLLGYTLSAYAALSKLQVNGTLFRYDVPEVFHTSPNTDRLYRYFAVTAADSV
jgi:hypothetical protein